MICYPRKSTFSANTRQGYLYLSVDFNLTRRTFLPTILYSDSGCTYQCILVYNNGIRDAYRVPLPRCKFVQIIFSCPLNDSISRKRYLFPRKLNPSTRLRDLGSSSVSSPEHVNDSLSMISTESGKCIAVRE